MIRKTISKPATTINRCLLPILTITLLYVIHAASAHTVVCRLSGVCGFDNEKENAIEVVGKETTHKVRDMKVYLTYSPAHPLVGCKEQCSHGHLFVYSNFISDGADLQTKIVTDENTDLMTILRNLVFLPDKDPTPEQEKEFKDALTSIKFYVQSALDSSKYETFRSQIEELKK